MDWNPCLNETGYHEGLMILGETGNQQSKNSTSFKSRIYMSVFTRLYIHSPWSLDTAEHTIFLATAHIHNHFWLLHPSMVPNSQLGGLESPVGVKPPAQSDTANDPWQHGYSNPRVAELHVTPSPESATLTTGSFRLREIRCIRHDYKAVLQRTANNKFDIMENISLIM